MSISSILMLFLVFHAFIWSANECIQSLITYQTEISVTMEGVPAHTMSVAKLVSYSFSKKHSVFRFWIKEWLDYCLAALQFALCCLEHTHLCFSSK